METGEVAGSERAHAVVVGGAEIFCRDRGRGPAVLFLHQTAASGEEWAPLRDELGEMARAIVPDRRGWGRSGAPEAYARTTIEEQAEDGAAILDRLGVDRALLCGAGLGAVACLDLLLRRPELAAAAVLIEPPLLAFLLDATEGLSADRKLIEEAIRDGGPARALDLYLVGGLPCLGPGAERIPDSAAASARERPLSLFAELAAVPAWTIQPGELAAVQIPSRIVVGAATPPLLQRAADELATRLGSSELLRIGGPGLPHVGAAPELAAHLRALL